jgi:AhpD family alkylhydroperoxidase
MTSRLNLNKMFPEAYRILIEMDEAIQKSGISPLYLELIKIRASQLNGCAFCLSKHTADAIKLGENPKRIFVISAWREAPEWFTGEEKTIFHLTEEITQIGVNGVSDLVYDTAIKLFGEEKTAYLIMAAININSWNRIGVGLNLHPTL